MDNYSIIDDNIEFNLIITQCADRKATFNYNTLIPHIIKYIIITL